MENFLLAAARMVWLSDADQEIVPSGNGSRSGPSRKRRPPKVRAPDAYDKNDNIEVYVEPEALKRLKEGILSNDVGYIYNDEYYGQSIHTQVIEGIEINYKTDPNQEFATGIIDMGITYNNTYSKVVDVKIAADKIPDEVLEAVRPIIEDLVVKLFDDLLEYKYEGYTFVIDPKMLHKIKEEMSERLEKTVDEVARGQLYFEGISSQDIKPVTVHYTLGDRKNQERTFTMMIEYGRDADNNLYVSIANYDKAFFETQKGGEGLIFFLTKLAKSQLKKILKERGLSREINM